MSGELFHSGPTVPVPGTDNVGSGVLRELANRLTGRTGSEPAQSPNQVKIIETIEKAKKETD